jgi:hypothetical protein
LDPPAEQPTLLSAPSNSATAVGQGEDASPLVASLSNLPSVQKENAADTPVTSVASNGDVQMTNGSIDHSANDGKKDGSRDITVDSTKNNDHPPMLPSTDSPPGKVRISS